MKNTDPPHRPNKLPKVTPEISKFIENVGMYFENTGLPRIGGRILGLLMISHGPLSAENIETLLRVSRGSISTNMRILIASGLVEKTSVTGDRTTFYVFPETALEQRMAVGIQSALAFKKVSEQGLAALSTEDYARHHLKNAIEWSDMLVEAFQDAITEWRTRQGSPTERKQPVY